MDEGSTSHSRDLVLRHPTPDECVKIWTATAESWGDTLPFSLYLKESQYLTTIPLAKNGNRTDWILVNKNLPPDQRPILSSCETFRKRSLTSDALGNITESIVHGIASVFCHPDYRSQGYAARLMKELANVLPTWQLKTASPCVGTILYSDIGKSYYSKLGWHPNATNLHIEFAPKISNSETTAILEEHLEGLCQRDEARVRKLMAVPSKDIARRVTIVPDVDHILWHIKKEEFATEYLFGKIPHAKGAIIGEPGRQIWAIWTHRYYDNPTSSSANNVLYILRLVVESDKTATRLPLDAGNVQMEHYDEQLNYLKAVLKAAQAEAAAWKLNCVKLWDPTPLVRKMVMESSVEHTVVEREEDSIASGMWIKGFMGVYFDFGVSMLVTIGTIIDFESADPIGETAKV
ncbi:hypothetical protein DM02DRAFT_734035 [Periconia macrospinosa]|uniref:N-acetyltransferase domain-containing protein n=1 Tax=Periconia macrospinosa TaxID=97972 RepID=A0A2V1D171_9PLEO|nr:hypothetical protein DM02DRAFT_734035 [Periconia macrospinosa]